MPARINAEVNVGDSDYQPLFAYGYGLSYANNFTVALLAEDPGLAENDLLNSTDLIAGGKATSP